MAKVGTVTEISCTKCGIAKPVSEYHKQQSSKYYHSECKDCSRAMRIEYTTRLISRNTDKHLAELDRLKPFKFCPQCRQTKPISDFHIDRAHNDGHHGYCMVCHRIQLKIQYKKRHARLSPEELIEYRTSRCRKARVRNEGYKYRVLSFYSGGGIPICANPFGVHTEPLTDLDVLTIDHINGDGHKHKSPAGRRIGSYNLCVRLIRDDFPLGYQVLCGSCQMKKAIINKEHPTKYPVS